jgi:dipeptidyl-peptidase-4
MIVFTQSDTCKLQENSSGNDENSPINHVDKLKGKIFDSWSGDDNVHLQKFDANDGSINSSQQTIWFTNLSR